MPQKLLCRGEGLHVQFNGAHQAAQRLSDRWIIVNDEYSGRHRWGSCFHMARSSFTGRVNSNVTPGPSFRCTRKCPPCACTIERLMDKPRPNPCGFVVWNGSKMSFMRCGSIPVPVS